jgi:hypothetical protein
MNSARFTMMRVEAKFSRYAVEPQGLLAIARMNSPWRRRGRFESPMLLVASRTFLLMALVGASRLFDDS